MCKYLVNIIITSLIINIFAKAKNLKILFINSLYKYKPMKNFLLVLGMLFTVVCFGQTNDATLDLTFNLTGKVTTSLGVFDYIKSVAVQTDGKIVVAGSSFNTSFISRIAVARYNSDGTLDNTFGSSGTVTTSAGISWSYCNSMAIQPDGKIVVAGYCNNGTDMDFFVARYNTNGMLDNTFNSTGIVLTDFGSGDDAAFRVRIQSDGKIVVAGSADNGTYKDFGVARYNADGTLDNTFGSAGKVTTGLGSFSTAYGLAIQTDGKIVVAGFVSFTNSDFAVVRYNTDGSLDNTFNSTGKVITSIQSGDDICNSVALQNDDKIILCGKSSGSSSGVDFAMARYNTDGSLDLTFNSTGKVVTDFGLTDESADGIAIQTDGKIVLTGLNTNVNDYLVIARYNTNGILDPVFGSAGIAITAFGTNSSGLCTTIQPDGKIIAAGHSDGIFGVVRFNGLANTWTGSLTTDWNTAGNWDRNAVPVPPYNAIIPSAPTNQPVIASSASVNNLIIASGASVNINSTYSLAVSGILTNNAGNSGLIIHSDATGTGNLINATPGVPGTVQRYLTGNYSPPPYHFISSPINNAPLSSIWSSGDVLPWIYDETDQDQHIDKGWLPFNGSNLTNGCGYAVTSNYPNRTMTFSGSLNCAPVKKSVTYTNTTGSSNYYPPDPRGWNLAGNPFPCSLDAVQFIIDNLDFLEHGYEAVYLWDEYLGGMSNADYATYNILGTATPGQGGSGANPNGKIALGQGFFVRVQSMVDSIIFTQEAQTTNSSSQFFIFDPSQAKRVWFSVKGENNQYSEILAGFLPEAEEGLDIFDAVKFKANENISLYSILDNDDLIIQGLPPVTEVRNVPIGLDIANSGSFTFYIKNAENFADKYIYLEDLKEGKLIDLQKEESYSCYIDKGSVRDRFILKFSPAVLTGIDDNADRGNVNIYSSGNSVYINISGNDSREGTVTIYDMMGKTVYNRSIPEDGLEIITLENLTGNYLVRYSNNIYTKTVKVFIP